jgi:uncharacterized protein (DUF2236 family)
MKSPTTTAQPVRRDEFEALCNQVDARSSDRQAGIFGPASISWMVNRESALFLGAGRAALLQLAHPWVAAALDRHSNLRNDPLGRFHNTFRVVFTMIFGTVDQAIAAARHLYRLHTRIQGEIPSTLAAYPKGSRYRANEVNALCWVFSTLVESALIAYQSVAQQSVLPPLTSQEREAYYSESKTLAALFGIPPDALPSDWSAFENYNRAMWASDSLGVNDLSKELAQGILHGHGTWLPIPRWYRALTAAWMPARFQQEFALDCQEGDKEAADGALQWLPRIYQRLPESIRFVGPYQEARARLAQRNAGPIARLSNRFWMGQPAIMFQRRRL